MEQAPVLIVLPRGKSDVARHMQRQFGLDQVVVVAAGSDGPVGRRFRAAYVPADGGTIDTARYEEWVSGVRKRIIPAASPDNFAYY